MLVLFGNFFFHSYILKKPTPRSVGVVKIPEPVQTTRSRTGRATLDDDGNGTVELPAFFVDGAVHYQVTPLGRPMPNLHVSREPTEANCTFALSGGTANAEVSWIATKVITLLGRPEPKPVTCCDNSQDAQVKKDQ